MVKKARTKLLAIGHKLAEWPVGQFWPRIQAQCDFKTVKIDLQVVVFQMVGGLFSLTSRTCESRTQPQFFLLGLRNYKQTLKDLSYISIQLYASLRELNDSKNYTCDRAAAIFLIGAQELYLSLGRFNNLGQIEKYSLLKRFAHHRSPFPLDLTTQRYLAHCSWVKMV